MLFASGIEFLKQLSDEQIARTNAAANVQIAWIVGLSLVAAAVIIAIALCYRKRP